MIGAGAMVTRKLRYVYEDTDRHGNVRVYFWRSGTPKARIREAIGTPEFFAVYQKLLAGEGATPPPRRSTDRPVANTWRALCVAYFASVRFRTGLSARTQHVRRQILEATFDEPISPGSSLVFADMPMPKFTAKPIRVLRDRKAATPEAANIRLKSIRQVLAWAIEDEHCGIKRNIARDVSYIRTGSTGFHSWEIDEVEAYESRHPIGTKARLALDLMLYLGVRRSDVVRLGRQHVRAGEVRFTPYKGQRLNPSPLTLPLLPVLKRTIDATPCGDLTFLVSELGRPFTSNGFGNRMRKWCDEAGLPICASHGLRKVGAVIAAENGATDMQLMAIFGWKTVKEAQRYTRAARQRKLAADGMCLLVRPETGTDLSHQIGVVVQSGKK